MGFSQKKCIGMVFSMTNESNNKVVAIKRDCEGRLYGTQAYETGGSGTNGENIDPLVSQGSIVLSEDGCFLFVVNAGSNSISSFKICNDKLVLVDVTPSGGIFPNSLVVVDDKLYVTNVGNSVQGANVVGFYIELNGRLRRISGAKAKLSIKEAQPRNIVASPCKDMIAVSEGATNNISTFFVQCDGTLVGPVVNASGGINPFGAAYVCSDLLVVTEAGTGALSSYEVMCDGELNIISDSVTDNQVAVCWVSVTPNKCYAYTSNTGSGTITRYYIKPNGRLKVLESIPSIFSGEERPIDNSVDRCGCNFYVLNALEGSISVFKIHQNGDLTLIQVYKDTQLPPISSQGLAVL